MLVHVHYIRVCAVTYNTLFFSAQKQSKPQSNSAVASGEESGEEEEEERVKESTKNARATQKHDFSDEEDENEVKLSSESLYL